MIKDIRTGKPFDNQRLATAGAPTPLALPGLNGSYRNRIISAKSNPLSGVPDYIRTNLINHRSNPHGHWFTTRHTLEREVDRISPDCHFDTAILTLYSGDWACYFQPGSPRKITRYAFITENGYTPNSWRLEGSNDGEVWTTLDTKVVDWTWSNYQRIYYYDIPVENHDFYQYWRIIIDTMSASSVRLRGFYLWENDESTDEYVHIYATPEDPLVLSFADGFDGTTPINHIVTLTEERIIDMAGVWRAKGYWGQDKFSSNIGILTAEYNPSSGEVSFSLQQEDFIGDVSDYDTNTAFKDDVITYRSYSERYLDGDFDLGAQMNRYHESDKQALQVSRKDRGPMAISGFCAKHEFPYSRSGSSSYGGLVLYFPRLDNGIDGIYNPTELDFHDDNYMYYGHMVMTDSARTYFGGPEIGLRSFSALSISKIITPTVLLNVRQTIVNNGDKIYEYRPFYDRAHSLFYNTIDGKMYWRDINGGGGNTHCNWIQLGIAAVSCPILYEHRNYITEDFKTDVAFFSYDVHGATAGVQDSKVVPAIGVQGFVGPGTYSS